MLRVYFGKATPDVLYNTRVYFDFNYEPEWLESDLAKAIIKDVDKSEVISPNHIESPVLGGMTAKQLSGGVKTLLLALNKPELFLNASTCGDNCAKWLLEIGKINNVKVNLGHIMEFGDDGFEFYCENTGTVIHNIDEMFEVTDEYL